MRAIFKNFHVVVLGFCVGALWGLIVASGPETVQAVRRWASPPAIQFEPFDVREMSLNGARVQIRGVLGPHGAWRWSWDDQDVSIGGPSHGAGGSRRRWASAMFNGSACPIFGYLDDRTGRFVFDRFDQFITDWPSPQ